MSKLIQNFLTVGEQVLILFVLIGTGFLCGKVRLLNTQSVKSINELVLYIVSPCVIVKTFIRNFEADMLTGLLIAATVAVFVHIFAALIAYLTFRDSNKAKNTVYRFAVIFSNCGFMSLPLQQVLLGDDGVFYGAVYIAVFNIFVWTLGVCMSSEDKKSLSAKKILLNPCIIAVVAGILIFILSIPVPQIISTPINYMAAMNTPLPMLIIGFYLSQSKIRDAFTNVKGFICVGLRLVIVPLITLGVLMLFGIHDTILITCVIASSAPVAATTTMFATKFGNDTSLSVNLVTLSTLLSIITMPLIVGFAQSI